MERSAGAEPGGNLARRTLRTDVYDDAMRVLAEQLSQVPDLQKVQLALDTVLTDRLREVEEDDDDMTDLLTALRRSVEAAGGTAPLDEEEKLATYEHDRSVEERDQVGWDNAKGLWQAGLSATADSASVPSPLGANREPGPSAGPGTSGQSGTTSRGKLTVSLPTADLAELAAMAEGMSSNRTTALARAIRLAAYLQEAARRGSKVMVEDAGGKRREIVIL